MDGVSGRVNTQDVYYIYNHLKFKVLVHKYEEANVAGVMGTGDAAEVIPNVAKRDSGPPEYMVVGFEVVPCSVMINGDSVNKLKPYDKFPNKLKCDPNTVSTVKADQARAADCLYLRG